MSVLYVFMFHVQGRICFPGKNLPARKAANFPPLCGYYVSTQRHSVDEERRGKKWQRVFSEAETGFMLAFVKAIVRNLCTWLRKGTTIRDLLSRTMVAKWFSGLNFFCFDKRSLLWGI